MDEVLIISGLNSKDIKAFDAIYDLLFNPVFFFTKNITRDEEEAADITTDALAKVWERHGQFESIAQVRNFLFRIARNASISYLRSLRAKSNYATHLTYLSAEEEENLIERYAVETILLEKLYHEIEKLPKKMQEVFKLCYIEGMTKAQVAQQLNMAEKTVYNTCSEALKKTAVAIFRRRVVGRFIFAGRHLQKLIPKNFQADREKEAPLRINIKRLRNHYHFEMDVDCLPALY